MNQQAPINEPVLAYAPNSPERHGILNALEQHEGQVLDIPVVVAGRRMKGMSSQRLTAPHDHARAIATVHQAGVSDVQQAVDAAVASQNAWANMPFESRAAVFLRAADLLAGPWRQRLNAATMLGQSKTVYQAEIDSACELIDFLRFNVAFARDLQSQQPVSSAGMRNALEYRPLEGFVYAVTPFNFTAIAGNLPCAPALLGNTVVWKPAFTASLSNYLFMQLLEEAGLPPGVINFVPGAPATVSETVMASPHFAGLHFTGSTEVFDSLWRQVANRLPHYRSYPRLVGETGGKDFVLAHPSANAETVAVALLRGAFEYQGQKCSAASRAYVPASLWPKVKDRLVGDLTTVRMGDVADLSNFMGAVIDRKAFDRIKGYIAGAQAAGHTVVTGGRCDDSRGYFVEPTVIEVNDPQALTMREEIFGPVLSVYVYADAEWEDVLSTVDGTGPYALTGAVFSQDRQAVEQASAKLRFSAGNFYINDKPTGAVVGQQPFGGGRRSGTNDKAGSVLNLQRWTSPRTVKETWVPATDYRYAHMS
ncbi:delta-1-pyrroline-5-carboxylate dehydrogenase [Comamonas sp. BIGb0124]|uniref:L-glutamate gamma-semialdehyde dehydrogenase n=1 Tax=Comamonas sp. BIGb0124 TaxID=2485130 RepID=UPI000F48D9AD|nr:L-glutamate gamma-semialdehyde dehydrogenase [Comamonas sp. BIGb0124]ROR26579.1 delta-1-pyrroline-5-carboxylate dehydrogenase [Comamonas sp. BIGb0124]